MNTNFFNLTTGSDDSNYSIENIDTKTKVYCGIYTKPPQEIAKMIPRPITPSTINEYKKFVTPSSLLVHAPPIDNDIPTSDSLDSYFHKYNLNNAAHRATNNFHARSLTPPISVYTMKFNI